LGRWPLLVRSPLTRDATQHSDATLACFHNLRVGVDYVVLACDGVWDVLDDEHAAATIRRRAVDDDENNVGAVPDARTLSRLAARLRDHAYCANSDDNVSVLVVAL
jgi:serine/threonine protein phosphatase PrpC